MFQFVNPPALQTSNRAEGNQKALQCSSHGKRRTVKAALYIRLGAGAWMRDEWLAFAHLVLVRAGADGGARKPAAPHASLHWVGGGEAHRGGYGKAWDPGLVMGVIIEMC